MKRFFLLLTCIILCAMASIAEDTMTFIVGNNVCTPITVRVGGNSYTVYSSVTISQVNGTVTATDCDGRKLKYEYGNDSGTKNGRRYSHSTYTFRNTYNASDNNRNSSGYNENSNYNSGGGYNYSEAGARIGQGLAHATSSRAFTEGGAYPGLHANMGLSKGFGEFLRLRLAAGGFQVYGGIGKDWMFNGINKDKFLWHAGFGGYLSLGPDFSRWGDVSFGLSVAENAAWENLSLTLDVGFNYWFGRWKRIGVFTGAGIGWGDIKDLGKEGHHTKTAWNLEAGISFRLARF